MLTIRINIFKEIDGTKVTYKAENDGEFRNVSEESFQKFLEQLRKVISEMKDFSFVGSNVLPGYKIEFFYDTRCLAYFDLSENRMIKFEKQELNNSEYRLFFQFFS